MGAERNLLFGVLALQAGLITSDDFIKACAIWATRKRAALGDVLVELGALEAGSRDVLERLLATKVLGAGDALRAGLADVPEPVRRSLADLGDAEIARSLAGSASAQGNLSTSSTLDGSAATSGRYTVTALHATGGIGRVWRARDHDLGREVALKEILPERSGDDRLRRRFLQEAKVTGQLEHPGVVPIYELSCPPRSDRPFYTMRLVAGRTLREEVEAFHRSRVAGTSDALALLHLMNAFVFVCNTIAYAHSRRVLHRDLKPQNVVVGNFGEVFVLDWGLAKVLAAEEGHDLDLRAVAAANDDASGQTVLGQALGTPAYMAPEQAAGRVDLIDYRTDVYGLGATLYEILTGHPPFVDTNVARLLRRVQEEDPLPPRQIWGDAPIPLETICMRALAKSREQRHASAIELAHEIQYWQESQRRQAEQERDRFFSLALSMLCIAGVDGYFKLLNPAWEKTLGWTSEELMARPFREFVHPDDVAATDEEHGDVVDGGASVNFENRYRCKDGSYKWLLWNSMPVVDQKYVYATAVDISERKKAEEALRDGEERYRSVVSAMDDGIILVDADGEIRACNASAERILGLPSEQIIGRAARNPQWRSIHADGSPFPSDEYPVVVTLRTGEPCSDVVMGVHKPTGELTWVSIKSHPLTSPDRKAPYAVLAVLKDISDRRRLEQELAETAADLARCKTDLRRLRAEPAR
jgi:eukaryotic-like serine/threonine-protein kinase